MLSVRQLGKWWRCAWNPSFLETEVKVSKVIEQCLPEQPRVNVKSQVSGAIVHRCWACLPLRQEALDSGPANTIISPKDSGEQADGNPSMTATLRTRLSLDSGHRVTRSQAPGFCVVTVTNKAGTPAESSSSKAHVYVTSMFLFY